MSRWALGALRSKGLWRDDSYEDKIAHPCSVDVQGFPRSDALGNEGPKNNILYMLFQRIRTLSAQSFIRSVIVAISGAAAAQFITIAFSPLITRLYGPEVFGVVGVFTVSVMLIASVSDLMYGAAIVLPSSDRQARDLFMLSVFVGLTISLISFIGFGAFNHRIAGAIGFTAPSELLMLAPVLIFLSALSQPFHHWLYRQRKFGAISRINVLEALLNNLSKSLFGLVAATAPVLLILGIVSKFLQAILLWISVAPSLFPSGIIKSIATSLDSSSLRGVAYQYRDFPLFRAPQKWLKELSYSIPALLLASLVNPAAVGFYLLANRVIHLPNVIIAEAAGPVFLARIAEARHQSESVRPVLLKGTASLAAVGLFPLSVILIGGPWLFSLVFGNEWETAGIYARWLSLASYCAFVAVPTLSAIPILGLQSQFLFYEVTVTVISVISLTVGISLLNSEIAAIALLSAVNALALCALIMWCLIHCDSRARDHI